MNRLTVPPHVEIAGRTERHNRMDDLLGRADALQIKRRRRWQRSIPPGLFQLEAICSRASPRSLPRRQRHAHSRRPERDRHCSSIRCSAKRGDGRGGLCGGQREVGEMRFERRKRATGPCARSAFLPDFCREVGETSAQPVFARVPQRPAQARGEVEPESRRELLSKRAVPKLRKADMQSRH